MSNIIRIGGRSSLLSKIQVHQVCQKLSLLFPNYQFETIFKQTSGDKDLNTPLWQMPGAGIFTKELGEDLTNRKIDIVIHSWKDLDLRERNSTTIVPVLPREDAHDLLLFKRNQWVKTPEKIRILTSSPRREFFIKEFVKNYFPTPINSVPVSVESVRGNIQTRLKKYLLDEVSAIIIAKAAIDRILQFEDSNEILPELKDTKQFIREVFERSHFMVLPFSNFPNAPAQGALAAEIRKEDTNLETMLRSLTDKETEFVVKKEREILSEFGGGCHQKIGVSVKIRSYGNVIFLRGQSEDGKNISSKEIQNGADFKFASDEVWPPNAKMAARQRERLAYSIPEGMDVFVSRGYAFPLDLSVNPTHQILWTAGMSTWKDLANRGFWVNGTCDGLGETEMVSVETIINRKPNFIKLTHLDSDTKSSNYKTLPTYYVSAPEIPIPFDISKIKAAYWRSGSEFEIVTKRFPELLNVIHFVGPGSTYNRLKQTLGQKSHNNLYVTLSFESWIEKHIKNI
ncbi:hydroxymethylbilane synthase [Leptospira sp. 96542]|nr:hydroxymethylbilane synthase [Leptospira sp. 96542]